MRPDLHIRVDLDRLFSIHIVRTFNVCGDVAQLEERCLRKAEVGGSIPLISTKTISGYR